MLFKYSTSIYFLLLMCFFSCKEDNPIQLKSSYTSFFAETRWTFYFFTNNDYELRYEGHVGNSLRKGRYFICDSTIVLLNNTEYFTQFGTKRLKVIDDNCLRDFWNHYYCDTQENRERIYENKFYETLSAIDTIESFHLFKKARIQAIKEDSLANLILRFEGIKIIDKEEAFEYTLKYWLPEYRRYRVHERVYIKPDPIRFYDIKEGKLVRIDEE